MTRLLPSLRCLALALWVGSIFFFALGVAPVAFHVLPATRDAGLVVGGSLLVLHRLGFACGMVYLLLTALLSTTSRGARTTPALPTILVALMLTLTAFLQFAVLPRMAADRASAHGDISNLPLAAPDRTDFDRLHGISEKLEGTVLLLGLLALLSLPAPPQPTPVPPPDATEGGS